MRPDSEIVSGKSCPESSDTFTSERLCEAVGHTLVWQLTLSVWFLFLHLGLDVVEGEREEGSAAGGHH